MLRVAHIDDKPEDLAHHQALMTEYFSLRPHLKGELAPFSSQEELLEAAGRESFDLYLLDILMPGENGIQLGRRLREVDRRGAIIYLTSSPDFAVESYATRAFYYLLKPVERQQLFQVLDDAVQSLSAQLEESVVIRDRGGMRRLAVEQVVYAELSAKRLCCHLASGEVIQSVTLRESFRDAAAPFLERRAFAMCGVSFVVNLGHVTKVERGRVQLSTGESIPLSRTYREEFTSRWLDYHLEGIR